MTASSLLNAMWLQLATKISGGAKFHSCELATCGMPFEVGSVFGRRADARFCSDPHRIEFNSRKRQKARRSSGHACLSPKDLIASGVLVLLGDHDPEQGWTDFGAIRGSASLRICSSTRLDRLARSTRDLLNLLGTIAEKGAGFKSLRDTWADTTTAHGRLMLTVLGGLAEFERELIRTRTGEGRERAKARGVILGRKPKLTSHQKREAIARREAGEVLTDIARSYNVSHSTISRLS